MAKPSREVPNSASPVRFEFEIRLADEREVPALRREQVRVLREVAAWVAQQRSKSGRGRDE
ncbi:hypothetical protein GCM10011609_17090 [Lentzea pudingi]|uniref:Uncharacterized protein n=1 Tax=Lentzea pudingi TaxID=1789439 RepID=A0ABQ2HHA4_9PSEU|nr:hypothetical protein GCM10011609_17090 [Lentzea pudingi]